MSYIILKWSALCLGAIFIGFLIIITMSMIVYGTDKGPQRVSNNLVIKTISPLVTLVASVALLLMIISGAIHYSSLAFSSLSWSPKSVAIVLLWFGFSPILLLLLGAVAQSQKLMMNAAYAFFTIPLAALGLVITGVWALLT